MFFQEPPGPLLLGPKFCWSLLSPLYLNHISFFDALQTCFIVLHSVLVCSFCPEHSSFTHAWLTVSAQFTLDALIFLLKMRALGCVPSLPCSFLPGPCSCLLSLSSIKHLQVLSAISLPILFVGSPNIVQIYCEQWINVLNQRENSEKLQCLLQLCLTTDISTEVQRSKLLC